MATITLDYDVHNARARKSLDSLLSMGLFQVHQISKKKTSLERAFEDIEKGKVTFVNGPKRNKYNV